MNLEELGRHYLVIDFSNLFTKSITNIYYKQGEIGTSSIKARLVKKNTPIDLTGCRVIVNILDEKGEQVVDSAQVLDAKNGVVEIVFQQVSLNTGTSFFELTVVDENYNSKKSPKLAYRVLDSLSEDAVIASEKYPILVNLIKDVDDLHTATNELSDKTKALNQEVRELNETMTQAESVRNTNEATRQENETARQESIANMQTTVNAKIAEVNTAKDNMVTKVDEKIAEVDEAKRSMITEVGNKITEMSTKHDELSQSIDDRFAEKSTEIDNQISGVKTELETARTDRKGTAHESLHERLLAEFENVDKLEETAISTVSTEGSSLSIEETTNGFLSNLKLEGKTLANLLAQQYNVARENVNINPNVTVDSTIEKGIKITFNKDITTLDGYCEFQIGGDSTSFGMLEPNTVYTVIYDCQTNFKDLVPSQAVISKRNSSDAITDYANSQIFKNGQNAFTLRTKSSIPTLTEQYVLHLCINKVERTEGAYCQITNAMIFKGDLTQNPPKGFIEGLKSVGEDTENIEVKSIKSDGNLFDDILELGGLNSGTGSPSSTDHNVRTPHFIKVNPNAEMSLLWDSSAVSPQNIHSMIAFYDINKTFIKEIYDKPQSAKFTTPSNCHYIKFRLVKGAYDVYLGKTSTQYVPYKSDKKIALYKDTDGTWKKPILRGVNDSVRDLYDSDALKYYKRCEEIDVSTVSSFGLMSNFVNETYITFTFGIPKRNPTRDILCDKLYVEKTNFSTIKERIWGSATGNQAYITISKSKLETQDVEGFKKWLQANPVTVVYQLAEEVVFECKPISLISYASETTYSIESGAISPKSSMKVLQGVGNVVNHLKEQFITFQDTVFNMFKQVLSGDMQSLAYELYPSDFEEPIPTIDETVTEESVEE